MEEAKQVTRKQCVNAVAEDIAQNRQSAEAILIKVYFQKSIGQLTLAEDVIAELIPRPIETVNRIQHMIQEIERMKGEMREYFERHSEATRRVKA